MNVPSLDLQRFDLDLLDKACREWGFFLLRGHGIPEPFKQACLSQIAEFFGQPADIKNQIRRSHSNSWGYYDAELTKNKRDWKEILDIGPAVDQGPLAGASPQWPNLPGFQARMETLTEHLHRIALCLIDSLAGALGTRENLTSLFDQHSSFLRLNHYPPCPAHAATDDRQAEHDGELGISHHTDAGALTVLVPDQHPALQVWHAQRWHLVSPAEDEIIINIGDVVQVWSNDRYRAPLHRVLTHPQQTRISVPYFLNPDYAYSYAPLSDITSQPHYKAINWGEFRARRSAGDYADYGEEVQISDYRLGTARG